MKKNSYLLLIKVFNGAIDSCKFQIWMAYLNKITICHKKNMQMKHRPLNPIFFNYESLKLFESYSPNAQFHTTQTFKQVMSTKELVFMTFMQVTYRVVGLVFSFPCHLQVDYKSITSCFYHHFFHESLCFWWHQISKSHSSFLYNNPYSTLWLCEMINPQNIDIVNPLFNFITKSDNK